MITPEYLEYKLDMLKVHKELNESILRDIARRIVKAGVTETASWQTERLQECGTIYRDITKAVSQSTKRLESEICADYEDMRTEVFDYDDEILIDNGYEPQTIKNISPEMRQIIDASLKKTTTEAVNLTKTTAVTTQNLYLTACDLAHMQVTSGAFPYQEAIKNAIISAAKQGVTVIYPSGWVSSLDVAVRRSVLTGVNQTARTLQRMRAEEMNHDLMELSAHFGARPSHAEWQGQIVSLSAQLGYLTLDDIGYGAVDGFMGANCRHNWYMYFEGDKRAYSDEQLREFAEQKVTYNGKEMLVSEGRDMQRRFERGIRKTKQELVMLDEGIKTAKDPKVAESLKEQFTVSSMKLKKQESHLNDFCKQTDLKRDRFREQAFATETKNGIRNFGKSTSSKAVWANKKGLTGKDNGGIIKAQGGKDMHISNINNPIEQRNTAKGNPNAILQIGRPLNNRQQKILDNMPEYDSRIVVNKKSVNMKDLSAMTAATGDEFAMFTKGSNRLIIRGNATQVNIDIKQAMELSKQGYKWSGHTHPGIEKNTSMPSMGDKEILKAFNQETSVIYDSKGIFRTFEQE